MAMADERPTTFLDYLGSMTGNASGLRLMLTWSAVILAWLFAGLIWLPLALIVPLAAFGLYVAGASAFHYGLLPEKAEWKAAQTTRDMRANTAAALAITVCVLLLAIMLFGF